MVAKLAGTSQPGRGQKRVSVAGKAIKQDSRDKGTVPALRVTTKDGKATIKTGVSKSTTVVVQDSMGSIVNEALLELNSHLLEHPHKVLPALRMVKNSAFGTLKCKIPQEWIHHTLIYFYNISKALWRDVLMRYAKARQLPWTEELLKKSDRRYNLKA